MTRKQIWRAVAARIRRQKSKPRRLRRGICYNLSALQRSGRIGYQKYGAEIARLIAAKPLKTEHSAWPYWWARNVRGDAKRLEVCKQLEVTRVKGRSR